MHVRAFFCEALGVWQCRLALSSAKLLEFGSAGLLFLLRSSFFFCEPLSRLGVWPSATVSISFFHVRELVCSLLATGV